MSDARWADLIQLPDEDLPLDEAALVIAAHANPGLDIAEQLGRLDAIAASLSQSETEELCHVLFEELGLLGDREEYDDPRNSYIDQVLDRRRGIPISLSLVLIEVGRRRGLRLEGVGMPGHFLVRDTTEPQLLIDAFDGGRRLDRSSCERLLQAVVGRPVELTSDMLAPTPPRAVLARMLANLDRSFERRADYPSLAWVTDLRLDIPGLPLGDRVQLAGRLGLLGRFGAAANVLDAAAAHPSVDDQLRARLRAEATAMRARTN